MASSLRSAGIETRSWSGSVLADVGRMRARSAEVLPEALPLSYSWCPADGWASSVIATRTFAGGVNVRPAISVRAALAEGITFRCRRRSACAGRREPAIHRTNAVRSQQPENRSGTRGGSGGRRQQPDQRRHVIVHRRRDGTQGLQVVQDAHLLQHMRKDAVGSLPGEQHGGRDDGIADVQPDREKDAPVADAAEHGSRRIPEQRVPCPRRSSRPGLRPRRAARAWPQRRAGRRRRRSRQTRSARPRTCPRAAPRAAPARGTSSAACGWSSPRGRDT